MSTEVRLRATPATTTLGETVSRQPLAFWALADAEGNEVCVCTWQDRD